MDTLNSVKEIYDCREKFIIVGLTGRTGSGCSTVAELLTKNLKEFVIPRAECGDDANEKRKYEIVRNYAEVNWKSFQWIKVKDIIASFILESDKSELIKFFKEQLDNEQSIKEGSPKKEREDALVEPVVDLFEKLKPSGALGLKGVDVHTLDEEKQKDIKNQFFNSDRLPSFCDMLKKTLDKISRDAYTKVLQTVGDNIRRAGKATSKDYKPGNVFALSERINQLVKIIRQLRDSDEETFIVVDALRNPFEALYFRERYGAFYLMAINTPDSDRRSRLDRDYNLTQSQFKEIDEKEYPKKIQGAKIFSSQDIGKCYEIADIHINNPNRGTDDLTELKRQLLKFVSLIMHPGLVMPTRVERCMQIAHTAKLNSGCLSRQVGAAVTDQYYSIKAVGWNTAPQDQTPCSLRNIVDFMNHGDKDAYSDYENNDEDFRNEVKDGYDIILTSDSSERWSGRTISYCFKDMYNRCVNKEDKTYTRSLHAEENAMLQVAKYGGMGLKDGRLFTTASPCELCSKKAYQLGISDIFYINPYPGISRNHILHAGSNPPELHLFSGAIGRAYHQLYEPIMPQKDEIELMFELPIPKSSNESQDNK
jgi:dCMP deaminase